MNQKNILKRGCRAYFRMKNIWFLGSCTNESVFCEMSIFYGAPKNFYSIIKLSYVDSIYICRDISFIFVVCFVKCI